MNDIGQEIQLVKNKKNALLPVSRLHEEILILVFTLLTEFEGTAGKTWDWLVLTKVCQSWRNIALDCPSLWADIKYISDVGKLQTFLSRSQKADLTISIDWKEKDSNLTQRYINCFKGHMDRVISFNLCSYENSISDWKYIEDLFAEPTHNLKRLTLHIRRSYGRYETLLSLHNLASSAPIIKLNELSLCSIALPWDHPIFIGLSRLSLSNIGIYKPTFLEIVTILEASPGLQSIKLSSIWPNRSTITRKQLIDLPHLEEFEISYIDYDVCVELFDIINIPNDVEWTIHCCNYNFDEPKPFVPKLMESGVEAVKLSFSEGVLSFISSNFPAFYLSFSWNYSFDGEPIPDGTVNSIFGSLGIMLGQTFWSNVNDFHLNMINFHEKEAVIAFKQSAWSHLLILLSNVQNLFIQFRSGHLVCLVEGFVAAMVETTRSDTHDYGCRKLQDFTIANAKFSKRRGRQALRKLVEYLQYRGKEGGRLRKLSFKGCSGIDDDEVDKLEKLNIADEIYWDEYEVDG